MAAALVGTIAKSATGASNVTSFAVTMPAGVASGEGVIVLVSFDGNGVLTVDGASSAGWTKLGQDTNAATHTAALFWLPSAIGGGSDNLTIATSVAERGSALARRITGHNPAITPDIAFANGAAAANAADPPNLAPGAGSKAYLWVAVGTTDQASAAAATAGPSGYSDFDNQVATQGGSSAWAYKTATASSENPGVFTHTSAAWVACTIAIHPSGGGAPGPLQAVRVGSVPPVGNLAHIVGSFLAAQKLVGFYPGVPVFGSVTIHAVARFGPTALGSAQAFGNAQPKATITRAVIGLGSAQSFGTAVAGSVIALSVTGIASAQSFGTLSFRLTKQVAGLASAQAFGTPTPRTGFVRSVPGLGSAQAFGTVTTRLLFPVSGVGSAQQFGTATARSVIRVSVTGIPSAQSFGTAKIPLIVQVPGLNHGVLFFHIVGTRLSGQELVGWHGEYLFGRPVFGMQYVIGGVSTAQQFGTPVFGMQYPIPGLGSAQQFGTPFIVYDQLLPVTGLDPGPQFGLPLVYRAYLKPPPEIELILTPAVCADLSVSAAACTEVLLVPSAWTEQTLTPAVEEELVLTPSVPE